jgi:glycerol-3-phosphate dehydrogenase (NAD(P)+)
MARVTVVGAGSWGTALAKLLAERGHDVRLWSHDESVVDDIHGQRVNHDYLPGVELPENIDVHLEHESALAGTELMLAVVPSEFFRSVIEAAAPHVPHDAIVLSATKGLEVGTMSRPSEMMAEILPRHKPAVLSGPSFAREVAEGDPTAIVVACEDRRLARAAQELVYTERFRVYTNEDVLGVELAAALKNVIALAAGIAAGLEYRNNSRAALITRGLAEITRLGLAMGARASTFAGLAGLGDLVLTCSSELSRNRTVGFRLGRGESLEDILSRMKMVAEGVKTTRAARELARSYGVEMPIVEEVHHILFEGKSPEQATADLMLRQPKPEYWGNKDAT